jgi:tetratricopeptide (TPR) repeat protein
MKKLLFIMLLLISRLCVAESLQDSLKNIELEWAKVYYEQPKQKQQLAYPVLLDKMQQLTKSDPNDAGVIYWTALIKASYAAHQNPVAALEAIHEVRNLLNKAIAINPKVMNGAAYVVLGTLYDKAPQWPIAFGDDATAKKMLETALEINPNGVANNYFYGEFLLEHDDIQSAENYFKKAISVPVRPEQPYPDTQLKHKAEMMLENIRAKAADTSNNTLSQFGR